MEKESPMRYPLVLSLFLFGSSAFLIAEDRFEAYDQDVTKELFEIANRHILPHQNAQAEAMKSGDLKDANAADQARRAMIKKRSEAAIRGRGLGMTFRLLPTVIVPGNAGPKNPKPSGIAIRAGHKFLVLPKLTDRWSGGGTQSGKFCDFRGHSSRSKNWMRLFYRIGDGKARPVPDNFQITPNESGFLYFYANDEVAEGNGGSISVQVLIENEIYYPGGS